MNYYRYNNSFEYIGVTETEPNDNLWTNIDYIDSFIKPMFINSSWTEGASVEELAEALVEENKQKDFACYNELLKTDWYFIRKQDIGEDIPQYILDERNLIRQKYAH
jgi:hypothetical protein